MCIRDSRERSGACVREISSQFSVLSSQFSVLSSQFSVLSSQSLCPRCPLWLLLVLFVRECNFLDRKNHPRSLRFDRKTGIAAIPATQRTASHIPMGRYVSQPL